MKYDPAAIHADERKRLREEGYRSEGLAHAASIMAGVARSGRTVPVVKTMELADHFAAYLRDGTIPPRSGPGSLSGVVED